MRFRFFSFALAMLFAARAAAAPAVVVSLPPVHSLVSAVMGGAGDAMLLFHAGQSPHDGRLKPSQRRALADADLIIWVGPALERPLEKILNARRDARVITLMERDGVTLLPARHGAHADPHIWLSPANAQAIARIAARELARIDPAGRDRYYANARALSADAAQLRRELQRQLRATAGAPYVVFHDAYRYFEEEFGLRPAAIVRLNPHVPAGAARARRIRRLIEERNVRCIFIAPQFPPALAAALAADSGARTGILDPLGAALTPGPGAWFALMRALADSLRDCLRE
ncbi:MAG: zinc ABC transporter substrate-binding protein [Gammaproteobacteria bacterium]